MIICVSCLNSCASYFFFFLLSDRISLKVFPSQTWKWRKKCQEKRTGGGRKPAVIATGKRKGDPLPDRLTVYEITPPWPCCRQNGKQRPAEQHMQIGKLSPPLLQPPHPHLLPLISAPSVTVDAPLLSPVFFWSRVLLVCPLNGD